MLRLLPSPGAAGRACRGDRRGIAALEYALLAGMVGMAVLGAAVHFAGSESSLFGSIRLAINAATAAATSPGSGSGAAGGSGQTGSGTGGSDDGGEDEVH